MLSSTQFKRQYVMVNATKVFQFQQNYAKSTTSLQVSPAPCWRGAFAFRCSQSPSCVGLEFRTSAQTLSSPRPRHSIPSPPCCGYFYIFKTVWGKTFYHCIVSCSCVTLHTLRDITTPLTYQIMQSCRYKITHK